MANICAIILGALNDLQEVLGGLSDMVIQTIDERVKKFYLQPSARYIYYAIGV